MRCLSITSPDNPRLKQVLRLRKPGERRSAGLLIAEGFREVERALAGGLKLDQLFFSPQLIQLDAVESRLPHLTQSNVPLLELPPALLRKVAYHDEPEGILAIFEQPERDLDALATASPPNPLWLIANGINKPGNLGAMARTACAAGAQGLIAADAEVDPYNPNAIRASTGAVFTLPIFVLPSVQAIDWLRKHRIRIAAATLENAQNYMEADLAGPLAVAIGREETGLSAPWIAAADLRITIPMHPGVVDSLNASNAAAIVLFEALRQRRNPTHSTGSRA